MTAKTDYKNAFRSLILIPLLLLASSLAHSAAWTDYAENKLVDTAIRAQSPVFPGTWYVALFTTCPTDSTAGTEVTGGSYARVSVAASLAAWAGTQSAGSTSASSGTGGTTSNNSTITFPTPTGNWGTVNCWGLMDASSSGNLWVYAAVGTPVAISTGVTTVQFAAGALTFQIDN